MKLSITIATKLHMMMTGMSLPASSLRYDEVKKMIDEGVLSRRQKGRVNAVVFVSNVDALKQYLHNHYGITDIQNYTARYWATDLSRSEAITLSGNSKMRSIRTFKGFLINSYTTIHATLHQQAFTIQPQQGAYIFIADYESFIPNKEVTIVGVENAENFSCIHQQQYLFKKIQPLFISRYPQNNDGLKWLQMIENRYLHFGDLDFEGINIYQNEYKKHLNEKCTFLIPGNIEEMLKKFGNRELYNKQINNMPDLGNINEPAIIDLITLFHKYNKVLEQEVFIKFRKIGTSKLTDLS